MHHQLLLGVHLVVAVGVRLHRGVVAAPVGSTIENVFYLFISESSYPPPGFRPMNMGLTNQQYLYLLELFRVNEFNLKLPSHSLSGDIGLGRVG